MTTTTTPEDLVVQGSPAAPVKILASAADVIDRHGHVRESYYNEGGFCTVGALVVAVDIPDWRAFTRKELLEKLDGEDAHFSRYSPAVLDALDALADHLAIDPLADSLGRDSEVMEWNDKHGATDVVEVLRAAAESTRSAA